MSKKEKLLSNPEPILFEAWQHQSYRPTDSCGTITAEQNNHVRGDTPLVVQFAEPVGLDLFNLAITGEVSMTVTCAASDAHHVPCVLLPQEQTEPEFDGNVIDGGGVQSTGNR